MRPQENNITQAMSLLSPEELEYYATPLAEQYAAAFNAYEVSPPAMDCISEPNALDADFFMHAVMHSSDSKNVY